MSAETEFVDDSTPEETASIQAHIMKYVAVLWGHRRLIIVSVTICLAAAMLMAVLEEPSYVGSAIISVDRDAGTPLDSNWRPQLYGSSDPDFLPTQAKLLTSRQIAERVVKKLGLLDDPNFAGPTKPGTPADRKAPAGPTTQAPPAERELIGVAKVVQNMVDVDQVKGTTLLQVSCEAPTPKLAANIANAVAEAYLQWNLEARTEIAAGASEAFTVQIQQLKGELETKERQLLAYGRLKDIVSLDAQSNGTMQNLESLNRDYGSAVADRVAKEARWHETETAAPDTIADSLSNGLVSGLRADELKLERDYAERLNLFKPEWPAMQQLKAQIDNSKGHIETIIRETVQKARDLAKSEYLTAMRREESLKGVLSSQKNEAMNLNSNAIEYNRLKTEVDAKRSMVDSLLKRQAEIESMARLNGGRDVSVRVVDRALVPVKPHRPSFLRNGVLGIFGGGFLGVGLAFVLSLLDRSIRSPEQVEQLLGLPSLGVIPSSGVKSKGYGYRRLMGRKDAREEASGAIELLPHLESRSRIAERYRDLRTALLLSRAGGVKSIVVTSCLPREGKTATAVNLAVVLGQLGKPVLLVDADLHRPRIHEILRIPNRVGLVSILAGNVDPARAIVKTEIPELSVIPSGPASPNPSGLLSSEAMSRFLSLAQMNFDYVILDAPPALPVADALVIGNQTDGVVLCVKGGDTPREQVVRVRDKLHRSNVRILGVLINDLTEERTAYADHYGYEDGYPAYAEEPVQSKATTV